jgi:hypothetical protein
MTIKKSEYQSLYLAVLRLQPCFLDAAASILGGCGHLGSLRMSGEYLGYVWSLIEAKADIMEAAAVFEVVLEVITAL